MNKKINTQESHLILNNNQIKSPNQKYASPELSNLLVLGIQKNQTYSIFKDSSFNSFVQYLEENKEKKKAERQTKIKFQALINDILQNSQSIILESDNLNSKNKSKIYNTIYPINTNQQNHTYLINKPYHHTNFESLADPKIFSTKYQRDIITLIQLISTIDSKLASSINIMYNFDKKNNYKLFKDQYNIQKFLEQTFLTISSFISQAYYMVKPDSILISLYFYPIYTFKNNHYLLFFLKKGRRNLYKLKKKYLYSRIARTIKNKKWKKGLKKSKFSKRNSSKLLSSRLSLGKNAPNPNPEWKKLKKIKTNLIKQNLSSKIIDLVMLSNQITDNSEKNLNVKSRRRIKRFINCYRRSIIKTYSKKYLSNSKKYSKFAILYFKEINMVSAFLTQIFNKRVNFQLTKIYYGYHDSNVLATILGFLSFFIKFNILVLNLAKTITFKIRPKRLTRLKYRKIPAQLTGLNIKLAGRIHDVRNKSRAISYKWQLGNNYKTVQNIKDKNNFTNKKKGGTFNVTVQQNTFALK